MKTAENLLRLLRRQSSDRHIKHIDDFLESGDDNMVKLLTKLGAWNNNDLKKAEDWMNNIVTVEKNDIERQIMICQCHSIEHQVIFWFDEEDGDLICEPHLVTHRNFFKRLWRGLRYAFGYKSVYGDWDSIIFEKEDLEKLREHLDTIKRYRKK